MMAQWVLRTKVGILRTHVFIIVVVGGGGCFFNSNWYTVGTLLSLSEIIQKSSLIYLFATVNTRIFVTHE